MTGRFAKAGGIGRYTMKLAVWENSLSAFILPESTVFTTVSRRVLLVILAIRRLNHSCCVFTLSRVTGPEIQSNAFSESVIWLAKWLEATAPFC